MSRPSRPSPSAAPPSPFYFSAALRVTRTPQGDGDELVLSQHQSAQLGLMGLLALFSFPSCGDDNVAVGLFKRRKEKSDYNISLFQLLGYFNVLLVYL